MKALILSGGKGTRLRPLTNTTTKQLLPVANRPILFYIMDMIKEAGVADIGIVVSSEWGTFVEKAIGDGSKWDAQITYILQSKPAGLAHAAKISQSFLRDSPFLMVLGDNIYKFNTKDFINQYFERYCDTLLLLKEVDNPTSFGIAKLNAEHKVIQVQEKPKEPESNLALAGVYLFSSTIHEAIDRIKPSGRGELEITDAIQKLIDMGKNIQGYILDGWWLDTGDKDDLLKANRAALSEFLKPGIEGSVDSNSHIIGKVEIMEGTVIKNSVIKGPASIAQHCVIKDSSIGPFVSIGPDTVVEATSIEDSIISTKCYIQSVKHIRGSILGKRVELDRSKGNRLISLFLGDDAKLNI
ncbi:MAG: glucose-1-phosphate thymidylyltransferase [Dehalococcoidia bacterium]